MSAIQTSEKPSKRQELREDRMVTLFARAWMFYEENRTLVYSALAGIVLVALGAVGYSQYMGQQGEQAEELLSGIVGQYEAGNYRTALDGTESQPGLTAIAEDYGSTRSGNLATFYAADALYRLGEYDQALEHFQAFDKTDGFIGASAYAGQAAIHENRGEYEQAAERYEQAAAHYPNELTAPQHLLDAGRNYEAAGLYGAATDAYERISDEYPESALAQQADRFVARAQAKQRS